LILRGAASPCRLMVAASTVPKGRGQVSSKLRSPAWRSLVGIVGAGIARRWARGGTGAICLRDSPAAGVLPPVEWQGGDRWSSNRCCRQLSDDGALASISRLWTLEPLAGAADPEGLVGWLTGPWGARAAASRSTALASLAEPRGVEATWAHEMT